MKLPWVAALFTTATLVIVVSLTTKRNGTTSKKTALLGYPRGAQVALFETVPMTIAMSGPIVLANEAAYTEPEDTRVCKGIRPRYLEDPKDMETKDEFDWTCTYKCLNIPYLSDEYKEEICKNPVYWDRDYEFYRQSCCKDSRLCHVVNWSVGFKGSDRGLIWCTGSI